MPQSELGWRTGYSAAQISRFERGIAPLNDVTVLRLLADALAIPHMFSALPRSPSEAGNSTGARSGRAAVLLPSARLGWPQRRDARTVKIQCVDVSSWPISR
ncbi:helix-turn-helix transcriptional regulator [Streptosporangium sp. NPDC051022]|uniref:helix-turn-helix domain-containing protein n=1 Tax=Streptosporangium sp. NPDC051022 TaxID=3155752 RepID=UPI003422CB6E